MPVLARTLPLVGRSAPDRFLPGSEPLEDALMRRSVGALQAGRVACRDCRRSPLLGERVYAYGSALVCELCRPRRRAAPDSSALVRSPEQAAAVRVLPA